MTIGAGDSSQGVPSEAIVVVHPGVQHSRELMRALHRDGLLDRFVTSLTDGIFGSSWLPTRFRERLKARAVDGIPRGKIVTIPYVEIATWLVSPLLGPRLRQRFSLAGLALFDRLAAKRVAESGPLLVVGAENSCRHLFRAARSAGAMCVLDAAAVHHSAQPAHDKSQDAALNARIVEAKDEEIRLADHVVVLSSYARDTYVAAGVPAGKVSVVPPGLWLPGALPARSQGAELRFLFVGNVKYAKGVDLLLGAFAQLDVRGKRLVIAGPATEPGALPEPLPAGVEYLGRLDRRAVFDAYVRSDVLVLPSRADGFGFVVAEAMSAGLPVIVSSATGAKDLVRDGVTGWIFPSEDQPALLRAMEQAAARRGELDAMGWRVKDAVAGLTWEAYGERIRTLYRGLLADARRARR